MVSDPLPVPQVTFVSVSTTPGNLLPSRRNGELHHRDGKRRRFGRGDHQHHGGDVQLVQSGHQYGYGLHRPAATRIRRIISRRRTRRSRRLRRCSYRLSVRKPCAGGGVVLEWSTREEVRNLGFHVYREDASGRHRLNPSMIAGGALTLRGGRPQHAAKTYRWIDPQGTAMSSYSLEDVDISGVADGARSGERRIQRRRRNRRRRCRRRCSVK